VNVKLVASLRQKVKAKVRASLDGGSDKIKETNRKNLLQKACVRPSAVAAARSHACALRRCTTSSWPSLIPEWSRTSRRRARRTLSWLLAFRYARP
jgi:hypothetical protein